MIVSSALTERTQSPGTGCGGVAAVAIDPANTPVFAPVSEMTIASRSLPVETMTVIWSIVCALRFAWGIDTVKNKDSPTLIVVAGITDVRAMPPGATAAIAVADERVVRAHCVAWYVKVEVPSCDAR